MGSISKCAILIDGRYYYNTFECQMGRPATEEDLESFCSDLMDLVREHSPPQVADMFLRTYYFAAGPCEDKVLNPEGQLQDLSQDEDFWDRLQFHSHLDKSMDFDFQNCPGEFVAWRYRGKRGREKFAPVLDWETLAIGIAMQMVWLSSHRVVDKLVLVTDNPALHSAVRFIQKEGIAVFQSKLDNANGAKPWDGRG